MTKLAPALDAALTLAAHGLSCFPIKARSKEPATAHGFKDATRDGGVLHRRFTAAGPDANLGVATGGGIIVVDLDGPEAEEWWTAHHGAHPSQPTWTWIAATGRADGGRHLYFKVDRPIASRPQKGGIGPHVDVKGEGGYVVAPPSIHPDGPSYVWEQGGPDTKLPLLAAPTWLLALLDEPRATRRAPAAIDEIVTVGQDDFGARRAASLAKQGFSRTEAKAALEQMIGTRFAGGWAGLDPSRPWQHEDIERWLDGGYAKFYDPGAPARAAADERLEARVLAKGPVGTVPGRTARQAAREQALNAAHFQGDAHVARTLAKRVLAQDAPDVATDVLIGTPASDIEAKAVRWLWKGRLPAGMLVILDGDPGLGKSTIVADWIARVTTGAPWPDGQPCELGGAIYVGAEDPPAEVVIPRLRAAGADLRRVRIVTTIPVKGGERLPILPADLALFERAVRETGARLLVLDPVISYVAPELSSYSDKDVRQALTPLADMLAGTACTGLMLRHLRKDDKAAAAMYRGGGSIAFVAVARAGFAVSKVKGADGATALMATKANLAPKSKSMRYTLEQAELPGGIETSRVAWGPETDDDPDESMTAFGTGEGKPREKAELLIQEFLGEGPRQSADLEAAAQDGGISLPTLKRAKRDLEVRARQVAADRWWVALPEHYDLLQRVGEVRFAGTAAGLGGRGTDEDAAHARARGESKSDPPNSNEQLEVILRPDSSGVGSEAHSETYARAREDEVACQHDAGAVVRRGRRFCAACAAALDATPTAPAAA